MTLETEALTSLSSMFSYVLELIDDKRLGLGQVPPDAGRPLEPPVAVGHWPNEAKLLRFERCREISDHLAVDGVRFLKHPLGFRVLPRLPCVQPDGGNSCGKTFVRKILLVRSCGFEADNGGRRPCLPDEFCPAAFCVSDVFP